LSQLSTLGALIRQRRQDLGLTQEQLAERIGSGLVQAEISRLEGDRVRLPRRHRLDQLAAALDVPVGDLLARTGWTGDDAAPVPITNPPPPMGRRAPRHRVLVWTVPGIGSSIVVPM
jgi:transcriptional regulator with XRE-family HTH domain